MHPPSQGQSLPTLTPSTSLKPLPFTLTCWLWSSAAHMDARTTSEGDWASYMIMCRPNHTCRADMHDLDDEHCSAQLTPVPTAGSLDASGMQWMPALRPSPTPLNTFPGPPLHQWLLGGGPQNCWLQGLTVLRPQLRHPLQHLGNSSAGLRTGVCKILMPAIEELRYGLPR